MPTIQIPSLPSISSIDGDEQVPMRDALGDVKITLDQIAEYVKDNLTPAEVLALVLASNPQVNGLNANLLQGLSSSFLRDASNLNAGVVPDTRLPQGNFVQSWTPAGYFTLAGRLKTKITPTNNTFGNPALTFQAGWTDFVGENTNLVHDFHTPFTSGFGTENTPIIILTPECRSSEYPASFSAYQDSELTMILTRSSLSQFTCASHRLAGSLSDKVRAQYFAIGFM